MLILKRIALVGIFTLIVIVVSWFMGYKDGYKEAIKKKEEELKKVREHKKQIIREFENYKENRRKQVDDLKGRLKVLEQKQSKIKRFIKELNKARQERNIDNLKQYTDRLIRAFKEKK